MRLLIRLLCLAVVIGTLGGCGFKDIDKRFFVVGTGIDWSGNKDKPYRITLQLAIPSPKVESGASKTQYEIIDAPSIAEGIRMLKSYVDKELDFGHCKMFLIGHTLADKDIRPVIDWMSRRRDIQSVANLAVGEPDAETVLKVRATSELYPGNALYLTFGSDGTESSYTYVETLSGLNRRLAEKGLDPALAFIRNDNRTSYIVNQIALMDKQKIKMMLSPTETQLFNQLSKHFTKASMHGMFKGTPIVIAINSLQSSFRIKQEQDETIIVMRIRMKVVFEEAPSGVYNASWEAFENELSRDYEKVSMALLEKIRRAGIDPFGFGLRYRAMHNGQGSWEQWQELYPQARFQVHAHVKVEGTGLIK
ncbi:hypothetical protein M6D81_27540 [Paenibacillus sp. J5C_2022]|uniref:Ger(x)C family spore germination protein n=1 Tax=Paenibacillus sp. J5C2022 TaxID=2977129 RepID=UPI0021D3A6FB|nr:Ger(x)C family spore germination C-terminal domain-containing protein [Paenibacillus sp. J5C2022]MCU6712455.1 hypothetical protein [Paenibacillus sp. J5C2022]